MGERAEKGGGKEKPKVSLSCFAFRTLSIWAFDSVQRYVTHALYLAFSDALTYLLTQFPPWMLIETAWTL